MTLPRWAAALAATLTLAACGDDAEDPAPAAGSGDVTAEAAAFPTTITHKFGKTEVEAEPKRVVTVGYTEQDVVLALGVTPVGTREFLGGYDDEQRPWAQQALAGKAIPSVGGEEINYEAVAARRPDLIVALNTGMTKGDYAKLSRIAPTIAQPDEYVDFGTPWQDQTRMIGQALGRSDKAEQVVEDVEAKFAKAKADHPEFAKATAVMAYGGASGYGAYTSEDTRSRFLADLGFTLPEEIDTLAKGAFYVDLSKEQFRLLDQDAVIMYGPQKEIEGDAVFKRSEAVKDDRIVYLDLGDQAAGALGFASPLSLPFAIDEVVPKLAAAVDGDPETAVEQPQ